MTKPVPPRIRWTGDQDLCLKGPVEKTGAALDLGQGRAAPSLSAPIPRTSVGPRQRWIRGTTGTPRSLARVNPELPSSALTSLVLTNADSRMRPLGQWYSAFFTSESETQKSAATGQYRRGKVNSSAC